MITAPITLNTNGKGLWSDRAAEVRIKGYEFIKQDWDDTKEPEFGELRVYFDKRQWDVSNHGLIYTDNRFLRELRTHIYNKHPEVKIDYSEQGMQGDDYVSLDYRVVRGKKLNN